MSEQKLKPCPFCGGEAYIHEIKEDFLGVGWKIKGYCVACTDCHSGTEYDKDKNISIKAWNRRAYEQK